MRSLLLSFSFLLLAFQANAQLTIDTLDRKGKLWLSGGKDIGLSLEETKAGYFVSDRLLVGSALGFDQRDDFFAQPFVRYYFGNKWAKWRPYTEIHAGLDFNTRKLINNYGGKLGIERMLKPNTLLNIDVGYEHFIPEERDRIKLSANLNTVFGGAFGKRAAQQHFKRGTLTLEGQLMEISAFRSEHSNIGQFNISPKAGLFLSNRFMAKASLDLSYSLFDFSRGTEERKANAFSAEAGLGLRYYITTNRLFNFFAEADMSFRYTNDRTEIGNFSSKTTTTRLKGDIGLGTSVFLNKSTSLDFGLKLSKQNRQGQKLSLDGFAKLNFWF